jgi:hypothetical protein
MERLPRPNIDHLESDFWIDEAIWGYQLADEQTPWLTFLEFLGIVQSEALAGRAFCESAERQLRYKTYHRLHLRNILFNNPRLEAILEESVDEKERWQRWLTEMQETAGGIDQPDFSYLRSRFNNFRDLVLLVKFLQSNIIEGNANKRWSSRFIFPYGPHCLYEDLHITRDQVVNDRRFFAHTGELLYLMLCRSGRGDTILYLLNKLGLVTNQPGTKPLPAVHAKWDRLVAALQPAEDHQLLAEAAPQWAYLPYPQLPDYQELATDCYNILQNEMPNYDAVPHLVTITGLHLIRYLLSRAQTVLGLPAFPTFIVEILSPGKTAVRDLSANQFAENNNLSTKAVDAYVTAITQHPQWQACQTEQAPIEQAALLLQDMFGWVEAETWLTKTDSLDRTLAVLRERAVDHHETHLGKFHRNWTREIGLASNRGSKRMRYLPTDALLKTLVLASVDVRMEFQEFLATLYQKYGLIIGDRQAAEAIGSGQADQTAFSDNARRLEQRLSSLGLLQRLSDACAYIQNPFALEGGN